MNKVKALFDEVVQIVKSALEGETKTPAERILDEYLPIEDNVLSALTARNSQLTAIPTSVIIDLASRTYNVVDCPCIQERIWEILIDHQTNPNLMKKALNLLHYLLINGSEEVVSDTRAPARASFLSDVATTYNKHEFEQYEFSQNLDIGAGARKTAADINALLENDEALLQARQEAEALHQKLALQGLRSTNRPTDDETRH
ncbi:Equilibrative nucleoside transporter protein [Plasmopara halstedii]|uniref:Equilibrative nucleoside transporter protein n=1 Tax=Plasmopara halstedii TaxID=4781 RepID=A0A0P1AVG0_PLAHL|nr:Equilibrative nucleoside transporter protein [Plasmopara halstedii]CEG45682.1 Equilibrative nucleoside transporter protein [Plasmopara halstedii]|eukprot:XP_024582051.1 Equilibrative nucleoside transporter protein [Plasmopara halstedii]